MKSMYATIAAGTILAAAAMAQEEHNVLFEKMVPQVRVMALQGSVMGKTVKGAPYSGVEISENTQILADGTRIHNESQTQVYRDSEGRMRRETPNEVTIWDPVANASWILNPKTQTARKLSMGTFFYSTTNGPNGEVSTRVLRTQPHEAGRVPAPPDAAAIEARIAEIRNVEAKIKTEIESHVRAVGTAGVLVGGPNMEIRRTLTSRNAKTEPLGKRTIEGMSAEGTRYTMTIEAGAIGNDRPIQSVTERWFSSDLQTVMLTRNTDPRTGEEVFKLVNVNRAEPAAYLFQVPAGYQIVEGK